MDVYYQSQTLAIYGGTISLIILATIAVAARLAARKISAAKLWWDDLVIVVALILDWGLSAGFWIQINQGGLGRHTIQSGGPVDPEHIQTYFKILLAIQVLYFASAVAIKSSLILLYYRIFGIVRWFRWLLAAVWTIVLLYFLVDVFVAIFECRPVAFYWDKSIYHGTCINENQFYRWNGVANLLIDFVIWSLTIPVIWRLKLNTRQKVSLSAIFLLGLLACVASIIRVISFNQVDSNDFTYTVVGASIWTVIEQSVGILCACLPTTRPLFGRLLFNIQHSSNSGLDDGKTTGSGGAIPLSRYTPRPTMRASNDTTRVGFARLDEENAFGINSIMTTASKDPSEDLPIVPDRIVKQHRLEQQIDDEIWS